MWWTVCSDASSSPVELFGGVRVRFPGVMRGVVVKSLGVVFFRSGGDGGQGGAVAGAGAGAVVGLEHVGQVSQ